MYQYADPQTTVYTGISVGTVVDTNDPQQMGRVRVRVEAYGDTKFNDDSNLPWAAMCTPFGGMVHSDQFTRGVEESGTAGPTAYGMFNVPKVGATALVTCIDGDLMTRVVVGYMHIDQTVHSMPHGRFLLDGQSDAPAGPINSSEQQIQPLYANWSQAFANRSSFEWKTRGADKSVGGLSKAFKASSDDGSYVSNKPDEFEVSVTESDGNKFIRTNGYNRSRLTKSSGNKIILDPQVYCWVTPGFHAVSMDDSIDNCRMRFRTSTGHQIILDDTNERIYISTNQGENWVEMDSDGSIDIYSGTKVSIHAVGDINLRSGQSIRLDADQGVHINSGSNVNLTATTDINTSASGTINTTSGGATTHNAQSFHINGGPDITMTADMIYSNGPEARSVTPEPAYFASRIPDHEPWGRISTAGNNDRSPKYGYDDANIGRENRTRNKYWHR
jgi:hypothetical protein